MLRNVFLVGFLLPVEELNFGIVGPSEVNRAVSAVREGVPEARLAVTNVASPIFLGDADEISDPLLAFGDCKQVGRQIEWIFVWWMFEPPSEPRHSFSQCSNSVLTLQDDFCPQRFGFRTVKIDWVGHSDITSPIHGVPKVNGVAMYRACSSNPMEFPHTEVVQHVAPAHGIRMEPCYVSHGGPKR